MRVTILFLFVCTSSVFAQNEQRTAPPQEKQEFENQVPFEAAILTTLIDWPGDVAPPPDMTARAFLVTFARAGDKVFVFPVLPFGKIQSVIEGKRENLLSAQGQAQFAKKGILEIQLLDLLQDGRFRQHVESSIAKKLGVKNEAIRSPEISADWHIQLLLEGAEGKLAPVGRSILWSRAHGEFSKKIRIDITPADAIRLHGSEIDDLKLHLTSGYKARYSSDDLHVKARISQKRLNELINSLKATPDAAPPTLIVPLGGGSLDHQQNVRGYLQRLVEIHVGSRRGATVNPELVKELVLAALERAQVQVKLNDEKHAAQLIRFEADTFSCTVALGKVTELSSASREEREKLLETLNRSFESNPKGFSLGTGFEYLGIGGFLNFSNQGQKIEGKEAFRKEAERFLNQMHKAVKGEIPNLIALEVNQIKRLSDQSSDEWKIIIETFRDGMKSLDIPLSFQLASQQATIPVVPPRNAVTELDALRKELELLKKQPKLKVATLSVIFLSPNADPAAARRTAGDPYPGTGDWEIVVPYRGDGIPTHIPAKTFGQRVLAVWVTPIRGLTYNRAHWGFYYARPGGNKYETGVETKVNQIELWNSAMALDGTGHIESVVHVLYEN